MTSPRAVLSVVQPGAESAADRAKRLQAETAANATEVYRDLLNTLDVASTGCADVESLTAIPFGVRNECRMLRTHIENAVRNMASFKARPA